MLTTAAKVALQNIPVVGQALSDLYDQAGEGQREHDFVLLQEVLARIDALGDVRFEDSVRLVEAAASRSDGLSGLRMVRDHLQQLQEEVCSMRTALQPTMHALEHLEAELFGLAWGAADFDSESDADHVTLLVLLQSALNRSRQIFAEQLKMAGSMIRRCGARAPEGVAGLDDQLRWLSEHGEIPATERPAFRELRLITDRMWQVNLRVRGLIRHNRSVRLPATCLHQLDDHLSTWLAKYEYLRENAGDHMALVFVGVQPTNKPFPVLIDAAVEDALLASLQAARLGHLAPEPDRDGVLRG